MQLEPLVRAVSLASPTDLRQIAIDYLACVASREDHRVRARCLRGQANHFRVGTSGANCLDVRCTPPNMMVR